MMKKLLAVLLAVCLLAGIGANAAGYINPKSREEAQSTGLWSAYETILYPGRLENVFEAALLPDKTLKGCQNEYFVVLFSIYRSGGYLAREDFAACDAILEKYFDEKFLIDFKVLVEAIIEYYVADYEMRELDLYETKESAAIRERAWNMPRETVLEYAAFLQFFTDEYNALINKINGVQPSFFATIWNFILKYIFFGWLWMR